MVVLGETGMNISNFSEMYKIRKYTRRRVTMSTIEVHRSQIWKFVSRFEFTHCTKSTFPQLTEIREINNTEIQNEHMGNNTGAGHRIKDGK